MKKILLVENDESIRNLLGPALEQEGYEVVCVDCGRAGLEKARAVKPDIILCDITLSNMSGIELCRSLKDDEEYSSIHIVMLTELGDSENTVRAFTAGANDCVTKPLNLHELLARIKCHLRMKGLYDMLRKEEEEKSVLLDVSQVLSTTVDPFENLYVIVSRIADAIDVKRCSIIYLDTLHTKGYVMASHDAREVQRLEIDLTKYPEIQEIMETRTPVIINDVQQDSMLAPVQEVLSLLDIKSIMAFPITFRNTLIGTLILRTTRRETSFNEREIRFCEVISHLASSPLKSAYLFETLTNEKEEEKGKRVAAESQLQLAAKVFENAIEGVMITDAGGSIQSVNPAFTTITGYSAEEVMGENPRVLKSDRHEKTFFKSMWHSMRESGHWQGEIWNRRKNGEAYPQWLTVTANKDMKGQTKHYVAVFHDVSEKKQNEERIQYRENHDALTGLPNKALFKDRLNRAIIHTKRGEKILAVLFLDLDHFKKINEGLGHHKGDLLLKQVADRLKCLVREGDTFARWGGDDFTYILEDVKSAEGAVKVARKIIKALSEPFLLEGREIHMTGSIGVALYPDNGEDADTLIKNADHALYRGKEKGRNYYQLFTPSMNTVTSERLDLENDLRKALEKKQLLVHYQPKVNLNTGEIIGMEALARWQHPEKGFVPPGLFIPIAEESGLIGPIGEWVLEESCRQNKAWIDAGHPPLRVSVNISAVQFHRQNLLKIVSSVLKKTGLIPDYLELEVTETIIMHQVESAIATMRAIREMGVHFSLDDFGTGYSSLSYLNQFPIDCLKIDRSFVSAVNGKPEIRAIAKAVISLGHSLNLQVIAEGAETDDHLRFLRDHQCDMVQGYVFSKPLSVEDFTRLLESGKPFEVDF